MGKLSLVCGLVGASLGAGLLAQNAGFGASKEPDTGHIGYFGAIPIKDNNSPEVASEQNAVLVYQFTSSERYPIVPDSAFCHAIEAQLIKNEQSLLEYARKLPRGTFKPQEHTEAVQRHLDKLYNTKPQVFGDAKSAHTRCYVWLDSGSRKPSFVWVVGSYRR
jgi:hypothetical protein